MYKTKRKAETPSELSEPIKRRLPAYYRALLGMYAEGYVKISSKQLAEATELTESRVRTDMQAIGYSGQTGYGYQIIGLYKRIGEVLRIHDKYSAVTVGAGEFAEAVCGCHLFTKRGIKLIGRFHGMQESEVAARMGGSDVNVLPFTELEDFLGANQVDIMILACDGRTALQCREIAEKKGVSGIMNFSELDIRSDTLSVRNMHIEDPLMMLCSEIKRNGS